MGGRALRDHDALARPAEDQPGTRAVVCGECPGPLCLIALSAAEQFEAATDAARRGLSGAKVYDLLTVKCALKSGAERVYALNVPEFAWRASPKLGEHLGTIS
jgi:hypothetical protein